MGTAASGRKDLVEAYFALRPYLSVAHHIPGRLRLRVSPKILGSGIRVDLASAEALLRSMKGVADLRINKAVGSVVIDYRPGELAPDLWERLLAGSPETVAAELDARLATSRV